MCAVPLAGGKCLCAVSVGVAGCGCSSGCNPASPPCFFSGCERSVARLGHPAIFFVAAARSTQQMAPPTTEPIRTPESMSPMELLDAESNPARRSPITGHSVPLTAGCTEHAQSHERSAMLGGLSHMPSESTSGHTPSSRNEHHESNGSDSSAPPPSSQLSPLLFSERSGSRQVTKRPGPPSI